jgi:hypothetical protein
MNMASILKKLDMDENWTCILPFNAIHTSLEDYHLAYHINKELPTQLKKNLNDFTGYS